MRFDDILDTIYGNGLYHIILTLFTAINAFISMYDIQSNVFMLYKPKTFECNTTLDIKWIDRTNYLELQNNASDVLSYNANVTEQLYGINQNNKYAPFKCDSWIYSDEVMSNNPVIEHTLIYDRSYLRPWLHVTYLFAMCMSYILAMSSDYLGRRSVFLTLMALQMLSNIAVIIVTNIWLLFIIMFVRGCTISVVYMGLSQITELLPIGKRSLYGNLLWVGWAIGYMACPGVAYWVRDWRKIKYVSIVASIAHPVLFYLFPKSPRWLVVRGKNDEAMEVWKFIIKLNKPNIPKDYLEQVDDQMKLMDETIKSGVSINVNNEGLLDSFKNYRVGTRLALLVLTKTALCCTYYGLITTSGFLTTNLFLNIFLQGLTEMPAFIAAWGASEWFGRRRSCSGLTFFSGVCMLITIFLSGVPMAKVIVGMVGKFCLTCAYSVNDLYIVELLPTTMRNSGFFFCQMVGSVTSSFTPLLNDYLPTYVSVIAYGVPVIISSVLMFLFLPETKNAPLPDTIEDCQTFVVGKEKQWAKRKELALNINENQEIHIDFS